MNRKWADGVIAALVLTLAVGASAWGQDNTPPKPNAGPAVVRPSQAADEPEKDTAELAVVAIDRAAKADKYVFMFVYRTEDDATKAARKTFDAAVEKLAARAMFTLVDVTDPLEREVVAKYGLERSPTPLVLALAPNGAVTRSFTGQLVEAQFETAFVSPGTEKCLKALQDRKLVFVCVQNGQTEHNAEALQGVKEFAADAQYVKTTEIITLDPTEAGEESFLRRLKVDPKTTEAVTVFMAPPGATVATYKGETKKDVLVAAAKTAAKACDPKSGCCKPKAPASPQAQPAAAGTTGKKP
jgi:hypothetical protein